MFLKKLNIQEGLSLGYVFLIVLGILSDTIYYGMLGVSYIDYTSILDALISPVSLLTNNYIIAPTLLFFLVLMYFYITRLSPKLYKKLRVKKWYRKIYNIEKWDKIYDNIEKKNNIVEFMIIFFFLMILSMRFGIAIKTKKLIDEGKIKANYTLIFKDNEEIRVRKIGQNSNYFFYLQEGEKIITVTPIVDNIKQIKRIKKE